MVKKERINFLLLFFCYIYDMKKKVINTTKDGLCRTIVSWYAKGGRTNFTNWKGNGHFAMTAVLEEYEDKESKKENNM